jgi:hypothetical protein
VSNYGLQIFDAQGRLVLDGTHKCGRIRGIHPIDTGANSSGTIGMILEAGDEIFFSFQPNQLFFDSRHNEPCPWIWISGNTINWNYQIGGSSAPAYPVTGYVIYGVF